MVKTVASENILETEESTFDSNDDDKLEVASSKIKILLLKPKFKKYILKNYISWVIK